MHRQVTRLLLPVSALCGLFALSACGGGDGEASTITTVTVAKSSYVTQPPATTTTTIPIGDAKPGQQVNQEQEYTVQSGDALPVIAEMYGVTSEEIANYNNFPSGVDEIIHPGQVIKIPPGGILPDTDAGAPAQATTTTELAGQDAVDTTTTTTTGGGGGSQQNGGAGTPTTVGDNCGEGTYTIEAGDYPIGVAEKFDVDLQALEAANAGTPGYSAFYPGLEIVIPAKSDC